MVDFIDDCFDGLLGDEPLREIETGEARARRLAWEAQARHDDERREFYDALADIWGYRTG